MKKGYFLGFSAEGFHRIAYREWGTAEANNRAVVCAHGHSRNGRDFDNLASYLSQQGLSVFCPDLVGRGESDWLKNPSHYTHEQYLADMNAMIVRTQASRIDWIGTSLGGLLGMVLASLPQSPIQRLVLNDIGPQIPIKGITHVAQYIAKEPAFFNNMEEAVRYYKNNYGEFGQLSDDEWLQFTRNSIRETSPGKFVTIADQRASILPPRKSLLKNILLHPLKTLEGMLFDIDLWDIWRKITCPVLVFHGVKSDILLPSTMQKMQQIHANTKIIEVPDAGHAPALLRREDHEMICRFLEK